jgi:hypothetical protein
MKYLGIVKLVTDLFVSAGVGTIVGNAIKLTMDPAAGRVKKIAMGVGGFALASMASDATSKYASEQIDKVAGIVSRAFKPTETVEADLPEQAWIPADVFIKTTPLDEEDPQND